jgi:alanine racemase
LTDIAKITKGELTGSSNPVIEHLLIDSRKIVNPSDSLFFAIITSHGDGHRFIADAFKKGVSNFIVSKKIVTADFKGANFIKVKNVLAALQHLATHHRNKFDIDVIGITGSNGKTIVKEWLFQLLHPDKNIIRSPRSYNSQVGVPLSVWQIDEQHELAIFEAGISKPGEMHFLDTIIQPTLGIITNIGEAHSEGFKNKKQKLEEKLKLFQNRNCKIIIANGDDKKNSDVLKKTGKQIISWGYHKSNTVKLEHVRLKENGAEISVTIKPDLKKDKQEAINFAIPLTDTASIENAITCCCLLLYFRMPKKTIVERMKLLQPVNMRLEMKKGINNCVVINDSYSADLSSFNIALNFLQQQTSGLQKTVILSDFLQTGISNKLLYKQIAESLIQNKIKKIICIGEQISNHLPLILNDIAIKQEYFLSTESFLHQFRTSQFKDETILIKGARKFEFEQITRLIEQKVHQTRLEINLDAIVHNLKEYQKLLKPGVKTMAMVKAYAYGSGGAEIAGVLQYHGCHYLGVAYADEGVELRKAGIHLPIMVMNPDENSFEVLVEYNLEPEIFSFDLLKKLDVYLKREALQQFPIHLEIETGMNRLGFALNALDELGDFLTNTSSFKIQSAFSHLASSDNKEQDSYTLEQSEKFNSAAMLLEKKLGYPFLKHIANSVAIVRMPDLHFNMVRPGIGLYGVDSSSSRKVNLQTVATLITTIAQIKKIKAGESVSYGRKTVVEKDSVIATVRIGYADGYPRRLGNGIGKMLVNGKLTSIIGVVCMDMLMLDITGMNNVKEGDEVIVFGKGLPVEQLAGWANTIPYEIMTGISQRVKRIYFQE